MTKFTNIDWERTEKYTDAEFAAIKRNADGDVCTDLDVHHIWMTSAQKLRLTGDDQSRVEYYEFELDYLKEQFKAEFGAA
jgi:hypothetical protein